MIEVEGTYPIGDLVHEICDRLGLDPRRVARLDFEPNRFYAVMRADAYRTKVSLVKGRPEPYRYVDPETGDAALRTFVFRVTTHP
ncbi:hypothetical protein DEJ49_33210 [Streptomyces venezuelae]|uniref:Uncharacterized protein n=1 Tax=Streptomyces venezuelae TaxID=54571 RepID=A0A5P2CVQ9_STRVZ|nr:hypothetical protein [Streptomyces venezuelae]QES45201.1 hypothetical protein DEJ49_33210 [Streptomyces venezuelae]